jgi:hypothetical protein
MPAFAKAVVTVVRGRLQSVTVNGQDLGHIGRLELVATPETYVRLTVDLLADVEIRGDVVYSPGPAFTLHAPRADVPHDDVSLVHEPPPAEE